MHNEDDNDLDDFGWHCQVAEDRKDNLLHYCLRFSHNDLLLLDDTAGVGEEVVVASCDVGADSDDVQGFPSKGCVRGDSDDGS